MTPKEGAKALLKYLGKQAAWRVNEKAPSQESREAARAALTALQVRLGATKQARDERHRAVLAADGEYQACLSEWKIALADYEAASHMARSYRITVGLDKTWCFEVKAQGDNWADVIRQLAEKEKKTA
jgi:hypothetical protein